MGSQLKKKMPGDLSVTGTRSGEVDKTIHSLCFVVGSQVESESPLFFH